MPHRDFVPPRQLPDNLRSTRIPQVELPEEFSFHRQYRLIDYQSELPTDNMRSRPHASPAKSCPSATSNSASSATSSSSETPPSSQPEVEVVAGVLTPTKPSPSPNMPAKRAGCAGKTLPKGFKTRSEQQAPMAKDFDLVSRQLSSSSSGSPSPHAKRGARVPPTAKRSNLDKPSVEHVHSPKESEQVTSVSSKSSSSAVRPGSSSERIASNSLERKASESPALNRSDSSQRKVSDSPALRPSDSSEPKASESSTVGHKTDGRPSTPAEEKLEHSSPTTTANLFPDFVPTGPMFTANVLPATPPIGVNAVKWFVFRMAARDVMLQNDYLRRCGDYVSPQVRFALGNFSNTRWLVLNPTLPCPIS